MAEMKVKCPKCKNKFYMQDYDRTACKHCGFVVTGPKYSSSSGGCFITTACVKSKGLPDDCNELQSLRSFRDGYISSIPGGNKLIQDYYREAPMIVQQIDADKNAAVIYDDIYEVIVGMEKLINAGKPEAAFKFGFEKYKKLKKMFG